MALKHVWSFSFLYLVVFYTFSVGAPVSTDKFDIPFDNAQAQGQKDRKLELVRTFSPGSTLTGVTGPSLNQPETRGTVIKEPESTSSNKLVKTLGRTVLHSAKSKAAEMKRENSNGVPMSFSLKENDSASSGRQGITPKYICVLVIVPFNPPKYLIGNKPSDLKKLQSLTLLVLKPVCGSTSVSFQKTGPNVIRICFACPNIVLS